jgi:D-alanyl-D-alanine carboxypeptidase
MKTHSHKTADDRLDALLAALRIDQAMLSDRGLARQETAAGLVVADESEDGKPFYLIPDAAKAWGAMKSAASRAGIRIELVSAFRTYVEQAEIISRKIDMGMPMKRILALSAPPGYSEHHTGRAIDIHTEGCAPAEPEFAGTEAFRWLQANAQRFGFVLSYPENNASGFIFEPWHWYYGERTVQRGAAAGSSSAPGV